MESLLSDNQIIGFIGFGNMGSAIAYSICDHLNVNLMVSEPDSSKHNVPDAYQSQIKFCTHADVFKLASIVFLAVKPQVLLNIVDDVSSYVEPHHLVVSMLAGTSIESLGSYFNTTQLVRIMPNTPALLGKGVTGIFFNPSVLKDNRHKIRHICDGFGYAFELDNEEQMHVITALSGSGPAFFYRIIAAFAQFAQAKGLDKSMSLNLSLNTMLGQVQC